MCSLGTQPCFEVTDMLLKRHFGSLFLLLEPLDIADEMFQAWHISYDEHDSLTSSNGRYERLEGLLGILSGKAELYPHFVNVVQSLGYFSVLDTLKNGVPFKFETCKSFYLLLMCLIKKKLNSRMLYKWVMFSSWKCFVDTTKFYISPGRTSFIWFLVDYAWWKFGFYRQLWHVWPCWCHAKDGQAVENST